MTIPPSRMMRLAAGAVFIATIMVAVRPVTAQAQAQQQQQQPFIIPKAFSSHTELREAVDNYLLVRNTTAIENLPMILQTHPLFQTYGQIQHWDVSRIDHFANLFNSKRNPLAATIEDMDLSQWDLSSAINTQDMFLDAARMDFDVTTWDVSNVERFNGMFEGCSMFQGRGLDQWDVSNGQLFMTMFSRATSLSTHVDLSVWKPRNALSMQAMFRDSNVGQSTHNNLCAWNSVLKLSVLTKDMFLNSQCPDESDPNLTQRHRIEISLCQPCGPPPSITAEADGEAQADDSLGRRRRPNVLFLLTDQQRFDTLRWVQDRLPWYNDQPRLKKIETPHLDRLLQSGAYFDNAYTQCAVCAPARTTLRTGNTVERHGVQANDLYKWYDHGELFEGRVKELVSIDQLLVEELGYISEYYGKWHIPERLGEARDGSGHRLIDYNDFDYATGEFEYSTSSNERQMRRYLDYFEQVGEIYKPKTTEEMEPGQQIDTYTHFPYEPIRLDSRARYGSPTNTPLSGSRGFDEWDVGQGNVKGLYSLSKDYTPTHFTGDIAGRALRRLQTQSDPWFMTVSFHSPHPPMVPSWEFLESYWNARDDLHVPRNLWDDLEDSNYSTITKRIPEYGDEDKIQEWTALYYALVEEVDAEIGALLAELDAETASNTLIVFTSDHGEMLGSHGKREKSNFYEEASKVPLMFSFPGTIEEGTVVDEKVSHLDVVATILDYVGASELDESDGTSLRPMIERHVINVEYDQDVAFGEWDFRMPTRPGSDTLDRQLDNRPTNLVRKGEYKLMIHKDSTSTEVDMMFDLSTDPYEMKNLVGRAGMTADDVTVAKAEHMRCLLLDWMKRLDGGDKQYFSNPINNYGEGEGDISEIWKRQSWKQVGFWVSDTALPFGRRGWDGGQYVRHEWVYMGTRMFETVDVNTITILGKDASYFQVDRSTASIEYGDCVAVRVTFQAPEDILESRSLDAWLVVKADGREDILVRLEVEPFSAGAGAGAGAAVVDSATSQDEIIQAAPVESTMSDPSSATAVGILLTASPTTTPVTATMPPSTLPVVAATSVDFTAMTQVCHMCPPPQCLQRPGDLYPADGITIFCRDIEMGGKHLLTPISVESCISLQNEMAAGVCGGCGTALCGGK